MTIERPSIALSFWLEQEVALAFKNVEAILQKMVEELNNEALMIENDSITSAGSITAHDATAIPAGGTAGAGFLLSATSNYGIFFGSGAPTLSAAKGSLYLRSDGSSTSTRAYINTDSGTTWTAITTAT